MKKLTTIILFALLGSAFINFNTGCTTPPDKPEPVDTTGNNNDTTSTGEIKAGFRIGVADEFKLILNQNESFCQYNSTNDRTYIIIKGNDGTRPQNEQNAQVVLEYDSIGVGTFTNVDFNAKISIGTGSGVKHEEFASEGLQCTITITEYGEIGEKVKGTFSGKVKNIQNSYDVKNGFFEVIRQ